MHPILSGEARWKRPDLPFYQVLKALIVVVLSHSTKPDVPACPLVDLSVLEIWSLKRMLCALQLKALSEDDLAHYWRLYVDKLADLLAEADARPHGPAPDLARRVQSLQREALFLHIRQGPASTPFTRGPWGRSCPRS